MKTNRMLIAAVVAVLLGLLASRFVYVQIQKAAAAARPLRLGQVVVAAEPLQLGTRLQPQQLRLIQWPADSRPEGSCMRIEDCTGRALITQVFENEPILEKKLAPIEAGAGLPAVIPEGMRAVSIRVDDVVGVAGFVMPGTMVDVLVTGDPQTRGGTGNTITRTFLENARVLAAGQRVQQDKDGKPQSESVVTLLVSPEEADRLAMASTEGKIHLALRNTIDTTATNPPPVQRASLFLGRSPAPVATGKPRPAAPKPVVRTPPAPYVVEVIRGDKKESQSFPEKISDIDKKD
ncbi:MAG: Flp pilus assembly protein CpaB [Acidobacteria bacterium]|nr:Flp pilus assembly protein CpaB [Acidobacteriota bacterium]